MENGVNVKVDEYLGASLKEYISLLAEIFHNHNRRIDASTAPLSLPQAGNGATTKEQVTKTMLESDSLREHLNMLKWVWTTNRNNLANLPCYRDLGPTYWIDEVVTANEESISVATNKIAAFEGRRLRSQQDARNLEAQEIISQRNREDSSLPSRPPLSYGDVESMRPAKAGSHDMTNRQWKILMTDPPTTLYKKKEKNKKKHDTWHVMCDM